MTPTRLPSPQNKGIFEILSTFFLVITILVVVIGLLFVNAFVIGNENEVYRKLEVLDIANDVKKSVAECFGPITPAKMTDTALGERCLNAIKADGKNRLKGIKIEELEFLSCTARTAEFGSATNCAPDGDRYVFLVRVEEGAMSCAARLELCLHKTGGVRS
ncbi:MAG: hypothetical protein J4215_03560 [Candidatus Diapherotrites archaeon]|uniref:Uncharacterized protein n=1 Tax=Candidatus Iainarchaeum sp. TaxID=3101447 RepID=A0A8T4L529_9ARCH|nr:hypothetical protein [Candidatus Diapherotrites archaeon]